MDDLKSCHNFHALLSFYSNFCLLSLYIKDMSSSDNNNTNEERYKFLNQYSKDLERSRTETAPPEVEYTADAPCCKDCGNYFFHDFEDHKYTCRCPHIIKESDIEFSPFNANARFKQLDELAKQSQQQRPTSTTTNTIDNTINMANTNPNPNRARIVTERGSTSSDGSSSYGSGGVGGNSNHTTFQSFDPRTNLIRECRGKYSDHSRTSVKQEPTFIHPLDKELIDKGYQIREVQEVKRQPNSPGVSRNLPVDPRAPKPYPRYTEDEDPY
jgi:hypothetical protein